jgi:hypothetical protein
MQWKTLWCESADGLNPTTLHPKMPDDLSDLLFTATHSVRSAKAKYCDRGIFCVISSEQQQIIVIWGLSSYYQSWSLLFLAKRPCQPNSWPCMIGATDPVSQVT